MVTTLHFLCRLALDSHPALNYRIALHPQKQFSCTQTYISKITVEVSCLSYFFAMLTVKISRMHDHLTNVQMRENKKTLTQLFVLDR